MTIGGKKIMYVFAQEEVLHTKNQAWTLIHALVLSTIVISLGDGHYLLGLTSHSLLQGPVRVENEHSL